MRRSIACMLLVCLASGAVVLAQTAGAPAFADPSGLWVGQATSLENDGPCCVNMTLEVMGQAARGVIEWVSFEGNGQGLKGFDGSWDAATGRATIREHALFAGEPVGDETTIALQISGADANVAWGTIEVGGVTQGSFHLTRAGDRAVQNGLSGLWQSLPGLDNPAFVLTFAEDGHGFAGQGSYLDREKRTLVPISATAEPVQDLADTWAVAIRFGESAPQPARYTCELDLTGYAARLAAADGATALLVHRLSGSSASGQSPAAGAENGQWSGLCVGVSDGDTITVMRDGVEVRVRFNGVDAPERDQPFSSVARQFTSDCVHGKIVSISPTDIDQYGRTVADVYMPDGRSLNEALVAAGLAWWFRRYAPDNARLQALQTEAWRAKRGLWADANPIAPWEFRQAR